MRDLEQYRINESARRFEGAGHLVGFLFMLVILGLLLYIAIATFRRTRGFGSVPTRPAATPPAGDAPTPVSPGVTPLEMAKMRYARGEITREEFETLRQDLQ